METVLRNINSILVYIDDVLLHTATHEEHLKVLEKVFERLHQNHNQEETSFKLSEMPSHLQTLKWSVLL